MPLDEIDALRGENDRLREELIRVTEERDMAIQPTLLREVMAKQNELLHRMRIVEVACGVYPMSRFDETQTLEERNKQIGTDTSYDRDS